MLFHAEGKAFQTQIQIEGVLRGLDTAQIPHKLRGAFGNESAFQTKPLRIGHAMIAFVGGTQSREFVRIFCPVKFTAVHNYAAQGGSVTIHVLGGGVGNNVSAPFKGTAIYRCGKGVVHNQRNPMGVGGLAEFLDIQYGQRRIGNGFAENGFGILPERGVQFILTAIRIDEGNLDTHSFHGDAEQIEAAAIDGGAGYNVIAAGGDIEHGVEIGCLTGAGEHGGSTAFQGGYFFSHRVAGGIGKTGIEITLGFQIEQLAHILGGGVFEGGTLNNGDLPGFAAGRAVAGLNAQCFSAKALIHWNHLINRLHDNILSLLRTFVNYIPICPKWVGRKNLGKSI